MERIKKFTFFLTFSIFTLLIFDHCGNKKDSEEYVEIKGSIDFNDLILRDDIIQRSDILLPYPIPSGGGFFKKKALKFLNSEDLWIKVEAKNTATGSHTRATISLDGIFSLKILKNNNYNLSFIIETEEGDYKIADLYLTTNEEGSITSTLSTSVSDAEIDLGEISIESEIALSQNNPLEKVDSDSDGINDGVDTDDDGDGIFDKDESESEIIQKIQERTISEDLIIERDAIFSEPEYYLDSNVTIVVNEGATLFIPGENGIHFSENSKLQVFGTVKATGKNNEMVSFDGGQLQWNGISVENKGYFDCLYCRLAAGVAARGITFTNEAGGRFVNSVCYGNPQNEFTIEINTTGKVEITNSTFFSFDTEKYAIYINPQLDMLSTPLDVEIINNIFRSESAIYSPFATTQNQYADISTGINVNYNAFIGSKESSIIGFVRDIMGANNYYSTDCEFNSTSQQMANDSIDSSSKCYSSSSTGGPLGAFYE